MIHGKVDRGLWLHDSIVPEGHLWYCNSGLFAGGEGERKRQAADGHDMLLTVVRHGADPCLVRIGDLVA